MWFTRLAMTSSSSQSPTGAIQRPVVEMLGSHAGRPVAHGAVDLAVAGRLGLLPADAMRGIVERGA